MCGRLFPPTAQEALVVPASSAHSEPQAAWLHQQKPLPPGLEAESEVKEWGPAPGASDLGMQAAAFSLFLSWSSFRVCPSTLLKGHQSYWSGAHLNWVCFN